MKITKNILINNLSGLEKYLHLNPYYDEKWLHSIIRYVSEIAEQPKQTVRQIHITVTVG